MNLLVFGFPPPCFDAAIASKLSVEFSIFEAAEAQSVGKDANGRVSNLASCINSRFSRSIALAVPSASLLLVLGLLLSCVFAEGLPQAYLQNSSREIQAMTALGTPLRTALGDVPMWKNLFLAFAGCLLFTAPAMAVCASYPNTLTNGTTADASQVMANFNCAALTQSATIDSATITNSTLSAATLSGATVLPGSGAISSSGSIGLGGSPSTILELHSSQPQPVASSTYTTTTTNDWYSQFRFRSAHGAGSSTIDNDDADIVIERGNHSYSGDAFTHDADMVFKINGSNRDGPASEAMRLTSQGYLGIATSSPSYPLYVNGTAYASGAAGALSDVRHKTNVTALEDGAIQKVMQLHPVTFFWKDPKDDGMRGQQIGFIAQDVEKILPSVVLTQNNAEKTKGLKYDELIPVLAKALQEQEEEIVALKGMNRDQATEVMELRTRLSELQRKVDIKTTLK